MSSRLSTKTFAVVNENCAMLGPDDTGIVRKVVSIRNPSTQDIRESSNWVRHIYFAGGWPLNS